MRENEIKESLESTVVKKLQTVLNRFSNELDIHIDELRYLEPYREKNCLHKMISGKRKGQKCEEKAFDNGYCKKHQKSSIQQMATLGKGKQASLTPKLEKKIPKTKQDIMNWLATAIPQKTTVLKCHKFGLIHEETDIIFEKRDEDYIAIGVAGSKKFELLTKLETDKCEFMGWRYDYDRVEVNIGENSEDSECLSSAKEESE
jgi:hypothetical protein